MSWSSRQKGFALALIVGLSLLQNVYMTTYGEFRPYADPSVRLRQIRALLNSGYQRDCEFPAARFVPDTAGRFYPGTYVTFFGEKCRYWFSPYAAALLSLPYAAGGLSGVLVWQHLVLMLLCWWMFLAAGRLGLPLLSSLAAIVLFRYGTAAVLMAWDIEIHATQALIFALAFSLSTSAESAESAESRARRRALRAAAAGLCIGVLYALRPEMLVWLLWGPAIWLLYSKLRAGRPDLRGALGLFLVAALMILFVSVWNHYRDGHFMGVKMLDPLNTFSSGWGDRLLNLYRVLLNAPVVKANALFFHMPILAAAFIAPLLKSGPTPAARTYALCLSLAAASVFVFVVATPPNMGGPYIGFRFGFFLYPALILLAFYGLHHALPRNKLRYAGLAVAALLCLYSLRITWIVFRVIGKPVYKHYSLVYGAIHAESAPLLVSRDPYINMSLSLEFFERPILFAQTDEDLRYVLEALRARGQKRVHLISHLKPALPAAPATGLGAELGNWRVRSRIASDGRVHVTELESR